MYPRKAGMRECDSIVYEFWGLNVRYAAVLGVIASSQLGNLSTDKVAGLSVL